MSAQQQINYGNTANDGQGDPLRTAFIKTDDNFDAIWNTGPVGSNVTILNNTVQVVAANGNLVLAANGIGVIQTNTSMVPRFANLYDLGSANLRYRSAYIGSGGLDVSGNLTVGGSYSISNLTVNSISSDDSSFVTIQDGLSVRGDIDTVGIYTDGYFFANGDPFSPGSSYGNAQVEELLLTFNGNILANTIRVTDLVATAVNTANIYSQFPLFINVGNSAWEFAGNILYGPQGGSWQDSADTLYLESPPNGYIHLHSVLNGNLVSDIEVEHSFIALNLFNGSNARFQFNSDGTAEFPNYTFPAADGAAGQILKTYGNGTLYWTTDSSDYGNANVVALGESGWSGNIIPSANVTYSLGNATNYWSNLWVANNTIYIGGVPLGVTGNTLTVNGEAVLSNDSDSSITTTGNISAGNILATGNMDAQNLVVTNIAEIGDISIAGGYITLVDGSASTGIDISPNAEGQAFLQVPNDDTANTANLRVVNNAGNVRIETNAGTIWTFGYGGDLTAPGNVSANAILTDNYFYANGEPFVSSSTGNITFTNTTMSPPDGEDLFITAANSEVEITGLDFRVEVTDDVRIQGNNVVSIRNTSDVDPITIITDYNNAEHVWRFGEDGSFEIPGDTTVAGDITGTSGASTLVLAAEPNSNTAIQLNDSVDSIIRTVANLEIRTDSSNTDQTWTFDTTGDLTAPGNLAVGTGGNTNVLTVKTEAGVISIGNQLEGTFVITDPNFDPSIYAAGPAFYITTNDSWQFTFGDSGSANVVFPGNLSLGDGTDTEIINPGNDIVITANTVSWTFSTDGVFTAPGNVAGANFITTGNVVGNVSGFAIGYRDIPQVSFTGNATIATTDAGKHFYSTQSTDYILTIANNASQGFQVGAAITIVNQGTGNITIAQGSGVSLYLAGNATSGNRNVTTFGMATLMKVATDTWFINGTGVV